MAELTLTRYVITYGLMLIFGFVLLEQLGVPIPALPVLIVSGSLAVNRDLSAVQVLAVAVVASLLADSAWYTLGRLQGNWALKRLCQISLSPDSCVRQTESVFERWGMPALLVAKFIPGFSTVAPSMAGAMHGGPAAFLLYDTGGALLWAGTGVVGGMVFHQAIDWVLTTLASFGVGTLILLAAGLVVFVAYKLWQRRRFFKVLRMARISVEELRRMMDEGRNPLVFDVRTSMGRARDPGRIKGAAVLDGDNLDTALDELPRDREIIFYCT